MTLLPAVLLILTNCCGLASEPSGTIDLDPFKTLAKSGACADIRNRLFLIDDQYVFWDRAGHCADAAYGQTLYGSTPEQVLCISHDSIAGPRKICHDDRYQAIFTTLTTHLDKQDLGLGSAHTVQPVPF